MNREWELERTINRHLQELQRRLNANLSTIHPANLNYIRTCDATVSCNETHVLLGGYRIMSLAALDAWLLQLYIDFRGDTVLTS